MLLCMDLKMYIIHYSVISLTKVPLLLILTNFGLLLEILSSTAWIFKTNT